VDPDITFLTNGLEPVLRVLFITVTGYLTLLVLLRVSGQRTLSQMTAFDLVITVTLGSAFGRVITAREVALIEVIAAFGTLILLQVGIAALWGRSGTLRSGLHPQSVLLYHDGEVVTGALRKHHLTEQDLVSAARQDGLGSLEEARAIVLEGNGSFAVISASQYGDGGAVTGLRDPGS
jgi:uncharacterized membrane protein YcaP (DUF421 family)